MRVVIIGGGVIGLSSAYYLQKSGHQVTVIDKTDITDNCSYGNAGYVCPSHFIPLATPGIVLQGLKWMWNSKSPFYVQPRFDLGLMDWGLKFMRSATEEHVENAAVPLRDVAILSKKMYEDMSSLPQFNFALEQKGLLEIFQTDKGAEHAHHTVAKAHELGLLDTELLDYDQLQALEPQARIIAKGAIHFKCDAHLYPNKLMKQLLAHLQNVGVQIVKNTEVTGFEQSAGKITKVLAGDTAFDSDAVVMATGSWSRELAAKLKVKIPLMPGRGYSVTLEDSPYKINHPAVLLEGRAALTPMDGNKIRFGGTMEITSTRTPPRLERVEGLLAAVKRFYPEFDVAMPSMDKIWWGYRPCSADGLPYLGKTRQWKNLVMATGHSMLGLSLGAGTGKLVDEIINEQSLSMDIGPFDPNRFD
ncbi:MAG: FAD-dependent oxidoreductase [Bacteroidetes bacterium 24-39-8]|nr:MAG: FAD-dependent oxidoreductase [Sphingobacteriia bacterium 35-40-8]OYZ49838.1 MAG: FAD-dependent oxidoreductase [Bacteroidetes bacterium 24-39-8]OZA63425.1 MAG: FAD-dependent oxidoreductase [Sphingobacteriia bacterium 39-39-8]HQR93670.1 FAD-dependent oxidoreductase [Sediminibacterium sp.]HQS55322.1 FAD-dependent oxidoreductase [Sediminibacterium sp.]